MKNLDFMELVFLFIKLLDLGKLVVVGIGFRENDLKFLLFCLFVRIGCGGCIVYDWWNLFIGFLFDSYNYSYSYIFLLLIGVFVNRFGVCLFRCVVDFFVYMDIILFVVYFGFVFLSISVIFF